MSVADLKAAGQGAGCRAAARGHGHRAPEDAAAPRENVLGPWLTTKSLNMVFGPRGEGKTFIALGVAIAIATGEAFLDLDRHARPPRPSG